MSKHLDAYKTTGSSPPSHMARVLRVTITLGSTVATGEAVDAIGRAILFAGDWRPMLAIAEALDAGEAVDVSLDEWQAVAYRKADR